MTDLLVLCYHAVSERWPADLSVTPDALRSQLELLVRRGYRGATLSSALAEPREGKTVVVTFDDGCGSVRDLAFPILEELGLPGTVFVTTDFVGGDAPMCWPGVDQWLGTEHERELVSISWDDARRLAQAGWEIGSHTCRHPYLTRLADDALRKELAASRQSCELELGRPCTALAYPYGDHDDRVVAEAGRAGYEYACTLPSRWHRPRPLAYPRVGIYHRDGMTTFRAKMSPAVRRLRAGRGWTAVERLRSAVRR
jgi:peptidoglycan/xylan/chitin deacetylase (PgdA/CDA1 family)